MKSRRNYSRQNNVFIFICSRFSSYPVRNLVWARSLISLRKVSYEGLEKAVIYLSVDERRLSKNFVQRNNFLGFWIVIRNELTIWIVVTVIWDRHIILLTFTLWGLDINFDKFCSHLSHFLFIPWFEAWMYIFVIKLKKETLFPKCYYYQPPFI